jgi:Fur family transcriptional regulator, ferric uptake regulator
MKLNDYKKLFLKEGLRFTNQRKAVYDILKDADTPLSAEEIYFKYVEDDQSISLSTIYRILELFNDKKMVIKSHIIDSQKATFLLNKHEHKHYLICLLCKKIAEIDGCPFIDYENTLEKNSAWKVTGHKLELFGYCPDCKLAQ